MTKTADRDLGTIPATQVKHVLTAARVFLVQCGSAADVVAMGAPNGAVTGA